MNAFQDRVQRTIAELQDQDYREMGARIIHKRMAWLDEHLAGKDVERLAPRDVYELLFFQHMGLNPGDLPIVSESADAIVWLSYNPCTLLEACRHLGLDTRRVCRAVNEQATQAFCSRINPAFRFYRSYHEIRPYAPYCREKIVRLDFQRYLHLAQQETRGHPGNGALVVYEDQVIGQGHDTAATGCDGRAHAGAKAIDRAAQTIRDDDLCGAVLFLTCPPCPTCATRAVQANVTTIVYAASEEQALPDHPSGGANVQWIEMIPYRGSSPNVDTVCKNG